MTITGADVLAAAAIISVVGGAAVLLWRYFARPILTFTGRANEFFDDWHGTDDRPGVPGRKGVMVRLATVETDKLDRAEFIVLAGEVAKKATKDELAELRVALERHITHTSERLYLIEEEDPPA